MVDIHQLTDNSSISGIRQWGKGSPQSRLVVKNGFLEQVMLETNSQWSAGINKAMEGY